MYTKLLFGSAEKRAGNSFSEDLGGGWDLMPTQNPVLNALYPGSACGVVTLKREGDWF